MADLFNAGEPAPQGESAPNPTAFLKLRPLPIIVSVTPWIPVRLAWYEGKPWMLRRDLNKLLGYKDDNSGVNVNALESRGHRLENLAIRARIGGRIGLFFNEDGLRLICQIYRFERTARLRQWLEQGGLQEVIQMANRGVYLAQAGDTHLEPPAIQADQVERSSTSVLQTPRPAADHIQNASTSTHLPPLHPGDRILSTLAQRPGEVVKTYPDGSACVRWDDGEPQEEGLGHERMPRRLLEVVPRVAGGASLSNLPSTATLMAVPPVADGGAEKRKAYCLELLKTTLRYVEGDELQAATDALEDMVHAIAERRPAPGLVAARYALFCKFWIEGGAQ